MANRINTLTQKLMNHTVLSDFFSPAVQALEKVRYSRARFNALPMEEFCMLGCLRHLQAVGTMREQLQQLIHLADAEVPPVARSTCSDALASGARCDILEQAVLQLVNIAQRRLPDRLANFADLSGRPVYAVDGSYQHESAHYRRAKPSEGGEDNPKGHMMLTFYDIRLGAPVDAHLETRNRHEMMVFKETAQSSHSLLRQRKALWVVDRAFVDMPFWDAQKKRLDQAVITRWKENLVIEQREFRPVSRSTVNKGIRADQEVKLKASNARWRLIRYRSPEGTEFQFLTNDLALEPGLVAFLYLRRWDEEKCFDTWKNDFSSGKAWSKSVTGIRQQMLLAIMTSLLLMLFAHHHQERWKIQDEKSLKKQAVRDGELQRKNGGMRPWHRDFYRATSKISKQVIRFLKYCFVKKSSPGLYEKQLRPMLMAYI